MVLGGLIDDGGTGEIRTCRFGDWWHTSCVVMTMMITLSGDDDPSPRWAHFVVRGGGFLWGYSSLVEEGA